MDDATWAASEDLIGLGLAAVIYLGVLIAVASWRLTAPLVVVASILQIHFGFDLYVVVASFNILPLDVLAVVLSVATLLRLMMRGRPDLITGCFLALAAAMLFGLLRGAASYGVATAVVSFRPNLYFIVTALYMMSFTWTPQNLDRFTTPWFAAGVGLALYTVACWIDPSVAVWSWMLTDPTGRLAFLDWRVLPASSTLLIAEAALFGAALWIRPGAAPGRQLLAIPLMFTVILLYHRSVWVTVAVALATLLALRPSALNRLALPVSLAVLPLLFIGAIDGELLSAAVTSAVSEPFEETSTWAWRTDGWQVMVPQMLSSGPITLLLGSGYGYGFVSSSGVLLANPHNAYVEVFVNAGLLGVGLLIAGYGLSLWRLWTGIVEEGRHFDRVSAILLLVALIVYSVPYSPSGEQGLLVGVIAGLAARCTHARRAPAGRFGSAAGAVAAPTWKRP